MKSLRKDREEGNRKGTGKEHSKAFASSAPALSAGEAPTSSSLASSKGKIFVTIPLKLGDYGVGEGLIHDFEKSYPRVDVRQELRSYRAWAIANPAKRKTKSGILRSINFWLKKSQDGNSGSHGGRDVDSKVTSFSRKGDAKLFAKSAAGS
jgi:hypothetical protein